MHIYHPKLCEIFTLLSAVIKQLNITAISGSRSKLRNKSIKKMFFQQQLKEEWNPFKSRKVFFI